MGGQLDLLGEHWIMYLANGADEPNNLEMQVRYKHTSTRMTEKSYWLGVLVFAPHASSA